MIAMSSGMLYAADTGAGAGGTPESEPQSADVGGTPESELTFDAWYGKLDVSAKKLLDEHTTGLRAALITERQQRSDLAKQLKDLAGKAQKGSELEQQLAQMERSLELAERKAAFAEDALRPEIGCVSLKAAWALALQDELFDRRGRPDWTALKQTAPELFRKPGTGTVDGGTGGQQSPRMDMNVIIRRAAGRG